jgi:hypothetical protein
MQIINSIGLQIRNSVGARLNMSGVPPALEEGYSHEKKQIYY